MPGNTLQNKPKKKKIIRVEFLPHSPYSADLAFLCIHGITFRKKEVGNNFGGGGYKFFKHGIKSLVSCWAAVVKN